MSKTSPSQIDLHIGKNIKLTRIKSGRSLQDLADILNVSFQQIQKYEKGQNKISSGNLFLISEFLDANINHFFEGLYDNDKNSFHLEEERSVFDHIDDISEHELTLLIKSYSKIKDQHIRKKLLDLLKSLSQAEDMLE